MATLVLVVVDWSALRVAHVEWLVTVAFVLLVLLWIGVAVVLFSFAMIAVSLRVDRLELGDGLLVRQMIMRPQMKVNVEGAEVKLVGGNVVVRGSGGDGYVAIPRLFYSAEDLERLWAATGLHE